MGPCKLKGKFRVSVSQRPQHCRVVEATRVNRGDQKPLGTSQMLLRKPKIAPPTLVGYSPVSPSGRMHSSPIMISAPYTLGKTMQEHSGAGRTFLLKGGFGQLVSIQTVAYLSSRYLY